MSLTIRPLTHGDEAEWRSLWRAYLAFYQTELPGEIYASTWARLLGDFHYDVRGLVAELDGRLVGLVHYLFHRHGWKTEEVVYLQDLFADPAVRGRGVGRVLIEAVYTAADEAGCPSVYWLTEETNYAGRMLYDRIGTRTPFIRYDRPSPKLS